MTCLEDYTFDYWIYLKKYIPNCIPEGFYYDNTTGQLVECNTITYKYFDVSDEKRICFSYVYECPPEYPYLN